MWSVIAIVGVTGAAAACVFAAGAVLLRRYYRRQLAESHDIRRKLSAYHRTPLSIDGNNYSQIPKPQAVLRRTHSPRPSYFVSDGWTNVPSQEHFDTNVVHTMAGQTEIDVIVPPAKRRKSLRQALYAHQAQSRRQKKREKAMPMHGLPRSPLSAITEFTDCTADNSSPAVGVIELPTVITPNETPERPRSEPRDRRPPSLQWPLPSNERPHNGSAAVRSLADGSDILVRMNNTGHGMDRPRPSLGQRSMSMSSNITLAPDEPLPPLPSIHISNEARRRVSMLRLSSTSVDTVGSSVLGTMRTSPPRVKTDGTAFGLASKRVHLGSPGLQAFEPSSDSSEHTAVTLGGPAGRPTMRGVCSSRPGIESLRASTGRRLGPMTDALRSTQVPEDSLQRLDASGWDADVPWRSLSFRTRLSPSLPGPVAREQRSASKLGKRASNPVLEHKYQSGSPRQPLKARPASVATGNPVQWDQGPGPAITRSCYNESPDHKKGHKRQNCVRISNLPSLDGRRNSRLPQMTEDEEEDQPTTPRSNTPKIPGLELLGDEHGHATLPLRPSLVEIKPSRSPFHNRPVLEPTSRSRVVSYSLTRSGCSSPRLTPDSDVFGTSRDASPHDLFGTTKSSPREWPLTPTATRNIKLNAMPANLRAVGEHYDEKSPVLPTAALTSATLFPYKSAIQGPRLQPRSGLASPSVSPSPAGGRHSQKRTATVDDLRRSVMMMRRMNTKGKPHDSQSRPYCSLGDESSSISSTANQSSPVISLTGISMALKSPGVMNAHLVVGKQHESMTGSNPYVGSNGSNGSKMSMAPSPSSLSMGGASVWEDVSVRGSPEPEVPTPLSIHTPGRGAASQNWELADGEKENVGRDGDDRDRRASAWSKTMSPPAKGLGLSVGNRVGGTPRSLYDEEGFLRLSPRR